MGKQKQQCPYKNKKEQKENDMKRIYASCLLAVLLGSVLLFNAGCSSNRATPPIGVGAARGAAAGAIAGQVIGRNTKSTMIGVAAGAAGGALLNDARARHRGY